MNKCKTTFALCTLLFFSASASASSIFEGYAIGSFSNPVVASSNDYTWIWNHDDNATPSTSYAIAGKVAFLWGTPAYYGDTSSAFVFQGVGSDATAPAGFSAMVDTAFLLGDFTYYNEPNYHAAGVSGVNFDLDVTITSPVGVDALFNVSLDILNTYNDSSDPRDYVEIAGGGASGNVFGYDGRDYILEILGFSRDGGAIFEMATYAAENSHTTAGIYARFTDVTQASPVPVPAALWLFGAGLIGLAAVARGRT